MRWLLTVHPVVIAIHKQRDVYIIAASTGWWFLGWVCPVCRRCW